MRKETKDLRVLNSISEFHRILGVAKPEHPLISVINFEQFEIFAEEISDKIMYNFYMVCMVKKFDGKIKYGQNYFDFDEGTISFISPGQILSTNSNADEGWILIIHPDFLRGYPLATAIKNYGYFSYEVFEALFLSEREEKMLDSVVKNIEQEYKSITDGYSQKVIISHIEVLLSYADRFYNRQFITRKNANHDLLSKLEKILSDYFDGDLVQEAGLPSVDNISKELHVSPHYLSDMLRSFTGMNTQQHIQNKLIEKAKDLLTSTSLSVAEVAFRLGFSHPQSFNKLFKTKTNLTPLEFRKSFN